MEIASIMLIWIAILATPTFQQRTSIRQIAGYDFLGFDLVSEGVGNIDDLDECIGLTQQMGGTFYAYNSQIRRCWPKNPRSTSGGLGDVVGTNLLIPNADFPSSFEMGSPNPVSSSSTTDCVRSCNNRAGCVIGVYKRATGECYLKAPYPAKAANVVSGYIETTSSSSPPPQENGNSSPPQANVPNQPKPENGKSVPAMDSIASTSSFSTSDNKASNGAVIGGGVGGGLVLLILAVGGILCFKRNKKPGNKKDQTKISGVERDTERDGLAQSQPEFLTSNSAPEYSVVNSVPGYYRAIQEHTAENEEQLTFSKDQRLLVTSMPNENGWCKASLEREGLVPASKLGVVG